MSNVEVKILQAWENLVDRMPSNSPLRGEETSSSKGLRVERHQARNDLIMKLREVDGLGISDIADKLDMSRSAVIAILHRRRIKKDSI